VSPGDSSGGRGVGGGRLDGLRYAARSPTYVDAHCWPVEDYLSGSGRDKHVWEDSTAVSIRLGDHLYDLVGNGDGTIVKIAFARGTRG
jgi:hypothetical protein